MTPTTQTTNDTATQKIEALDAATKNIVAAVGPEAAAQHIVSSACIAREDLPHWLADVAGEYARNYPKALPRKGWSCQDPAARMAAAAGGQPLGPDAPRLRMQAKLEAALRVVSEELSDGERLALVELWELADQTTSGHRGYEPTDMRCTPNVVRLLAAIYEATWTDPDRDAEVGDYGPFGATVSHTALRLARGEETAEQRGVA